jgi:hypothetical protein
MKRYFIASMMMIAVLALVVNATPPPANGGYLPGWGMNPTNWNNYSGSFTAWGIYDPLVGGGNGWVVGYGIGNAPIYIQYAPITLELWIEMYALQTYHYTSYQWHRLGNAAEHICFTIEGLVQSNNGQYVSLVRGQQDLTNLWFIHDIFDRTGIQYGSNLPLTWMGRWGRGLIYGSEVQWGWELLTPGPDLTMLIGEPCDHWFQFEGCFDIPYHQADGYYNLTMAGCPAPEL